ncbi:hypothetical protein Ate02nite_94460 [Paractinoplanes tereljensis]|uniref:Uncharacterized protein n=1 Tax=Paractinoplanes tereljensis TaxID=571912 RepID=A0A919NWP9_9ACTN|nr:hypothetical protein Ate02nite_94460 [Actinoplanes tereljensis]
MWCRGKARPQNGGYGHPDHIQNHRVTMATRVDTGVSDQKYDALAAHASQSAGALTCSS